MTTPARDYRRVSPDDPGIASSNSISSAAAAAAAAATATGAVAAGASDRLETESHSPSSTYTPSTAHLQRTFVERLTDKLVAAAWVALAVVISVWTDTVKILFHPHSSEAIAGLLQLAAVGVGINTVLVFYLTVYLPYGKGLTDSSAWPVYCPRVIPTMTITGVITAVALVRATWPVWGVLSPLILGVQALGLLFSLHFIPVWPQT